MNIAEFKAWFEGLSEGMDGLPNEKQWQLIKDRINGLEQVTENTVQFQPLAGQGKSDAVTPVQPKVKVKQTKPYFINDRGMVLDQQGDPINPSDYRGGEIWDHRGMDGDMATIKWADGTTGLQGIDAVIVGV